MRKWKVIHSDEMSGMTSDLEIVAVGERAEVFPLALSVEATGLIRAGLALKDI